MADHTANPKCKRRMSVYKDLNDVLNNEYDSTKLLIPTGVLDECKEMYLKFTSSNPNPKENIQRVEITGMDNHFNKLNHIMILLTLRFMMLLLKSLVKEIVLSWVI